MALLLCPLLLVGFRFGVPLAEIRAELRAESPVVRQTALRRLSFLGATHARNDVLGALRDPAIEVRHEAARLAASMGLAEAAETLTAWLTEPTAATRAVAAETLRWLIDRDNIAVPILVRMLNDADAPVRRAAAVTLADLEVAQAEIPMMALLDDPDPFTRETAATSLGRLGSPATAMALSRHLQDPEASVRAAILRAIGELARSEADSPRPLSIVPPLNFATSDADDDVAVAALQAMSAWAPEAAVQVLAPLVEADRPSLAHAAARLLGAHTGGTAKEVVWQALWRGTALEDRRDVCGDALEQQASDLAPADAKRLNTFLHTALEEDPSRLAIVTDVVRALPKSSVAETREELVRTLLETHAALESDDEAGPFFTTLAALGGTESLVAILSAVDAGPEAAQSDLATAPPGPARGASDDPLTALHLFIAVHGPQPDAAGPLLARLRAGNEGSTLLRILEVLARTESAEAAKGVRPYLSAHALPVRVRAAAVSLAGGDVSGLSPLLAAMASHDAAVREVARHALARYARAPHLASVLASVVAPGSRDRRGLLDAAGAILQRESGSPTYTQAVTDALHGLAQHNDPRVSFGALAALARWGTDEAVDIALQLRDRLPADREAARLNIVSQARRPSDRGREALREALASPLPSVMMVAAFGLAQHGEPQDVPRLQALADSAPYPSRVTMAYAYARLSSKHAPRDAAPALCSMVRSRIAGVRINGVRALRSLGRTQDAPATSCEALETLEKRARHRGAALHLDGLGTPSPLVLAALHSPQGHRRADNATRAGADWLQVQALSPISGAPMTHGTLMLGLPDGYMVALPADGDGALFSRHLPEGTVQLMDALAMPLEP